MKTITTLAALLTLSACGGSAFTAGDHAAGEAGTGDDAAPEADGGAEAAMADSGVPVDAADSGTMADSAMADAPDRDGGEGGADAGPCTCGGGISCFYSVSPPVGHGAGFAVATHVLTPSHPSDVWVTTVDATPSGYYDYVWDDIDVSAFPAGGTLTLTGVAGPGCPLGSLLTTQCPAETDAGLTCSGPSSCVLDGVENTSTVDPDAMWSLPGYVFGPGTTVLHLGSQGAWNAAPGTTNTNTIHVSVQ